MGRAPCCDKANVKRGPWSPEEDATLKSYVESHGTGGNWIALPTKAGLRRCGKSCRLRWLNYLRPDIKHGGFTDEEDSIICSLYIQMGSRWSVIASQLPGRTDNDVKNYWNTKLKKKLFSGKISLTTNSTQSPFTDINHATTLQAADSTSTVILPCFPKAETHIDSAFSNSQTQSSSAMYLTDTKPALTVYDQRVSFDPYDQLYKPRFMDFNSEFGTSTTTTSKNSPNIVSSSTQEGSSILDSCNSVLAMGDKYCHDQSQLPGNVYDDEEAGFLMDFGYVGLPYYDNIVNGGNIPFEEKPSGVDYSYVGIRPEGVLLNQSVNNDN